MIYPCSASQWNTLIRKHALKSESVSLTKNQEVTEIYQTSGNASEKLSGSLKITTQMSMIDKAWPPIIDRQRHSNYQKSHTLFQRHNWLPAKALESLFNVRLSPLRIVFRCWMMNNFRIGANHIFYNSGELFNCVFVWISDVNWRRYFCRRTVIDASFYSTYQSSSGQWARRQGHRRIGSSAFAFHRRRSWYRDFAKLEGWN